MPSSELQFIDNSSSEALNKPEVRRAIRQHVMKEIGRARRRPRKKRGIIEIPLDLSRLEVTAPSKEAPLEEDSSEQSAGSIGSFWWLGAGQLDPFLPYPIELKLSDRKLVAHIFCREGETQRAFRDAWFAVALADAATFHQVLSNSALHFDVQRQRTRRITESSQAVYHHTLALQEVNKKLASPETRLNDEVVGAISGFIVHNDIVGDFEKWETHSKGLDRLLSLRGGICSVNKNEVLRITISWVDLRGAYSQDIPPRYPLPSAWIAYAGRSERTKHEKPYENKITAAWQKRFTDRHEWIMIYEQLAFWSKQASLETIKLGERYWTEQLHAGGWTNIIIFELLQLRPLRHEQGSGAVIGEICRIASLLYLAPIWRKFGVHPVRTAHMLDELKMLLEVHKVDWQELWPLHLWVLFVASAEPAGGSWFALEMCRRAPNYCTTDWWGILEIVKGVLWVEGVFAHGAGIMQEEHRDWRICTMEVNFV